MIAKIFSFKLKTHETTKEHIPNMNAWLDLEIRLLKKKKNMKLSLKPVLKLIDKLWEKMILIDKPFL